MTNEENEKDPLPVKIAPEVVKDNPWMFISGALLALFLLFFIRPLGDAGDSVRNFFFPVVKGWTVTSAEVVGPHLVLSGTMVKQRGCLHWPPNLARDVYGDNYVVHSQSPTIGISYPPSPIPFQWGPWSIEGGAGKVLDFYATYQCGPDRQHQIVKLGTFNPSEWPQIPQPLPQEK